MNETLIWMMFIFLTSSIFAVFGTMVGVAVTKLRRVA